MRKPCIFHLEHEKFTKKSRVRRDSCCNWSVNKLVASGLEMPKKDTMYEVILLSRLKEW